MIRFVLAALALLLIAPQPASAALSRSELANVGATPAPGAQVPLSLIFSDVDGHPRSLAEETAGRPALLILADYRCTQLCGSVLGIAGRALSGIGLSPKRDFSLVVVGFNSEAGSADGIAMRDAVLIAYPEVRKDAHLLTGAPGTVTALETAVGFTAVRDPGASRFAHPVDLYVLTPEGKVSRVLNGLSLDPDTVRLALVEAGQGRIGTLIDRLHVLCYGLDPLTGASTGLAQTMLRTGASLTLLCACGLTLLAFRRRSHGESQNGLETAQSPHAEEARRAVSKHGAVCKPLADPSTQGLRGWPRMRRWRFGQARQDEHQNSNGLRP